MVSWLMICLHLWKKLFVKPFILLHTRTVMLNYRAKIARGALLPTLRKPYSKGCRLLCCYSVFSCKDRLSRFDMQSVYYHGINLSWFQQGFMSKVLVRHAFLCHKTACQRQDVTKRGVCGVVLRCTMQAMRIRSYAEDISAVVRVCNNLQCFWKG